METTPSHTETTPCSTVREVDVPETNEAVFEVADNNIEMTATSSLSSKQPPRQSKEEQIDGLLRTSSTNSRSQVRSKQIHANFVKFSALLAAVPASALACLGLATAQLGNRTGAIQSGILYLTYTLSSVSGATVVVSRLGSLRACIVGATLFGLYVLCFWMATIFPEMEEAWAWSGATLGGIGAGILWTAQGVYFTEASQEYAWRSGSRRTTVTAQFGGIFAFWLLLEETVLDASSTILTRLFGVPWSVVFALYSGAAMLAIVGLCKHVEQPSPPSSRDACARSSFCTEMVSAVDLLTSDIRTKYLIGFNIAFGWSGAFLNSFVSGEVVPAVLGSSTYVGALVALHGGVAALASLLFGRLAPRTGKGPLLIVGGFAFAAVGIPFLIMPDLSKWNWIVLVCIYGVQGIGRATFEGSLRATFSDWFSANKEGAFANIILQNGLATGIGYFLSLRLTCSAVSRYCMEYRDETIHNTWSFAWLEVIASLVGIIGYCRAAYLNNDYEHRLNNPVKNCTEDGSSRHQIQTSPAMPHPTYHTIENTREYDEGPLVTA